jgi:hypothetical protein
LEPTARTLKQKTASHRDPAVLKMKCGDDLPEYAPADLDHTRATGISLRQTIGDEAGAGGAVEGETGVARVEDVEDVHRVATDLELCPFIDGDVPAQPVVPEVQKTPTYQSRHENSFMHPEHQPFIALHRKTAPSPQSARVRVFPFYAGIASLGDKRVGG